MKATLAFFTIGCILSCLFYASSMSGSEISARAASNTWIVDANGTGTFKTIQAALDYASSGDTIRVRNGTYYENVSITKSVVLIKDSLAFPIIDGNRTGDVIRLKADNVTIDGFTIRNGQIYSPFAGIRADLSNNVIIRRNRVESNYRGIVLTSCSNCNISDNTVLSNSIDGIGFHSSTSNIVTGNNVSYNPGGGITFYSSNNNTVTNNIVSHNSLDGISVTSSSDNLISRNVIRSNSIDGVILSASTNNTISSNTIADNSVSGFALLYYSSNNVIYHNNIQNAYQVSIDPTNPICAWSYNGEGNYWSDYRGRDPDGDGIGNESYSIDRDNEDKYPLMGTFSVFYMTFKGKQYDAVIISNSTIAGFGFEIGPETGNRIIRFNVTSAGGVSGFCRIRIPVELMNYSYIVMIGQKEITPAILNISDRIFAHLYFAFTDGEQTVRIISSDTLRSYGELLNRYLELQSRLLGLNLTYYSLVNNYSLLLDDYSKLQGNYNVLNDSYQEHLLVYSESAQNLRNLTYILAFVAGILIVTVAYLSRRQRMVARLESNTLVEDKH